MSKANKLKMVRLFRKDVILVNQQSHLMKHCNSSHTGTQNNANQFSLWLLITRDLWIFIFSKYQTVKCHMRIRGSRRIRRFCGVMLFCLVLLSITFSSDSEGNSHLSPYHIYIRTSSSAAYTTVMRRGGKHHKT